MPATWSRPWPSFPPVGAIAAADRRPHGESMEIEPLSVEATIRGDAANAIEHAAELLGLPYDRAIEQLALGASETVITRAARAVRLRAAQLVGDGSIAQRPAARGRRRSRQSQSIGQSGGRADGPCRVSWQAASRCRACRCSSRPPPRAW